MTAASGQEKKSQSWSKKKDKKGPHELLIMFRYLSMLVFQIIEMFARAQKNSCISGQSRSKCKGSSGKISGVVSLVCSWDHLNEALNWCRIGHFCEISCNCEIE